MSREGKCLFSNDCWSRYKHWNDYLLTNMHGTMCSSIIDLMHAFALYSYALLYSLRIFYLFINFVFHCNFSILGDVQDTQRKEKIKTSTVKLTQNKLNEKLWSPLTSDFPKQECLNICTDWLLCFLCIWPIYLEIMEKDVLFLPKMPILK